MQSSNTLNVSLSAANFARMKHWSYLIDCSIQALLSAPNPDDPLSENIAKHWKTNEAEAVETGNVGNFLFVKMLIEEDILMKQLTLFFP